MKVREWGIGSGLGMWVQSLCFRVQSIGLRYRGLELKIFGLRLGV